MKNLAIIDKFKVLLVNESFWTALIITFVQCHHVYSVVGTPPGIDFLFYAFLSFVMLVSVSIHVEELFFFWATVLSFPGLLLTFYKVMIQGGVFDFFQLAGLQFLIVLFAVLFNHRLNSRFISEQAFGRMKRELQESRENSLKRTLNFSLVGCMKDRQRVISQSYQVLSELFKAQSSAIFLADYERNLLIPVEVPGVIKKKAYGQIMVKRDFWAKHASDPEKGVLSVLAGRATFPSMRELVPDAPFDAIAALPLSSNGRVNGLLAIVKQNPEDMHLLDPGLLITFSYVLASALDNCAVHEMRKSQLDVANKKALQIESSFGKYVSPSVVTELLASDANAVLGGKKMPVSIMIVDLRGFTSLTGLLNLDYLVQMLNGWFEQASSLILRNHGTIDKYMGDGIMVIFGAPLGKADDTLRAVYTAFRLHEKFQAFKNHVELPKGHSLGLGISIASGEAVVGNFGSSIRMEYTAIGEVANLAARLEKFAEPGEIVIDENTFNQLPKERFRFSVEKDVEVKGLSKQTVYRLTDIVVPSPAVD